MHVGHMPPLPPPSPSEPPVGDPSGLLPAGLWPGTPQEEGGGVAPKPKWPLAGQLASQQRACHQGGKKIALRGVGVTRKPIFPTPAPPSLAAVTGGGVQGGGARPAVPGGGGQPNIYGSKWYPRRADHVDYSNVGGGGGLLVEKTFSGQNLCSCVFGANIRSYTKQRARHGTPFLQHPPLLRRASMPPPPPPPPRRAIFRSPR